MIRKSIAYVLSVIAILTSSPVYAVALEARATDNTVCDFGNSATDLVYRKLLSGIHGHPNEFTGAMQKWIATNCANGQTLLIGDDENKSLSEHKMEVVAISACRATDVTWQKICQRGYRLRCTISKLDDLKKKFGDDGK